MMVVTCRAGRLASSVARAVSEAGRRAYQSRGFVCKQMHLLSQPKPIPVLAGFTSPVWLTHSIRRKTGRELGYLDQTCQRGEQHLSTALTNTTDTRDFFS